MKTLIIYDNDGRVYSTVTGDYSVPVGIQYMEVVIPEGKRLGNEDGIGVDTSVEPHEAILVDLPKGVTEELETRLEATEATVLQLMMEGM